MLKHENKVILQVGFVQWFYLILGSSRCRRHMEDLAGREWMPGALFCHYCQKCLWGHSAAKTWKHIKAGYGNFKPPRRMHMRGNRCIFGRWVSFLLVLLTSLMYPLFTVYLFLLISLSMHISRWSTFWLYCLSGRCSESSFKWKHPFIWFTTWHCLVYFRIECDTSRIAQTFFILEIAPCNCI